MRNLGCFGASGSERFIKMGFRTDVADPGCWNRNETMSLKSDCAMPHWLLPYLWLNFPG